MPNREIAGFAEVVFSGNEEDLKTYPEIIENNLEKERYTLASSNLEGAMERTIEMAMVAYTSGQGYSLARSKLELGREYVDQLVQLCDHVSQLDISAADEHKKKINGFSLALVLVYCMLLHDYERLRAVATIIHHGRNVHYGSKDLRDVTEMLKAYVNDNPDEFGVCFERFKAKKKRPAGYDLALRLCGTALARDQILFDSVLSQIEDAYPKRKTDRAYKGIQAIWGPEEYNDIYFDFFSTAIASYAKNKYGMKVEPRSDRSIPREFI